MITYMKSLVGRPFEFYSCFIRYSSKDQEFVERLYADLQSKAVRCWFAPEDLKIGEKFRTSIDEAIRRRDKLLLVLSTHSITSEWVETEVETAFEEEHRRKKTILFPIRLDNSVEHGILEIFGCGKTTTFIGERLSACSVILRHGFDRRPQPTD